MVSSHELAKKEALCNTESSGSDITHELPRNSTSWHEIHTDKIVDEHARKVSSPESTRLHTGEQSCGKNEFQWASEFATRSIQSDVCESDSTQQAKLSSSFPLKSMKKPFSITLPGGNIVSFSSKQVIDQNILRIIQAFWKDFEVTGPFNNTQEAVLIFTL